MTRPPLGRPGTATVRRTLTEADPGDLSDCHLLSAYLPCRPAGQPGSRPGSRAAGRPGAAAGHAGDRYFLRQPRAAGGGVPAGVVLASGAVLAAGSACPLLTGRDGDIRAGRHTCGTSSGPDTWPGEQRTACPAGTVVTAGRAGRKSDHRNRETGS